MVERHRIPEPGAAGSDSPPSPSSLVRQRRLLEGPANDNRPTPAQRLLRAAVFVVIGGALAYLLREMLG